MNAKELLDQYRSDMVDTAKPYLWTNLDVYRYMADAYRMFVRLTGGIADFTSDFTRVAITAGDNVSAVDPRILRFMEAYRVSDSARIEIINQTDLTFQRDNDYGRLRPLYMDNTPGPVRYMIIGSELNKVKWVQMPEQDDVAQLSIYRLPSTNIDPAAFDPDFAFPEISEVHHTHLGLWMRHLGYLKADAETFDRGRSDDFKQMFGEYCTTAKAEWERYKHKTRVVTYGGV